MASGGAGEGGSAGRVTLVLGGARSGKSRHAQALAEATVGPLTFVATAEALDAEMAERIARHRSDRGPRWTTAEAPVALAEALEGPGTALVDCLTLWTSNLLLREEDEERRLSALLATLAERDGATILVANEVGLGIVPDNALARRFRDLAGTINQRVAAAADTVDLCVAGLVMPVKRGGGARG